MMHPSIKSPVKLSQSPAASIRYTMKTGESRTPKAISFLTWNGQPLERPRLNLFRDDRSNFLKHPTVTSCALPSALLSEMLVAHRFKEIF